MATAAVPETRNMHTLPGDAVRQIQWRFADRFDLQMLVQSARTVARSTVARMVAAGERNTHEWTAAKAAMFDAFDRSGITAAFMEPEEGGFIAGPKNLALSLAAFELAWVDGGAATASLASFLALCAHPRAWHPGAGGPLQVACRPAAAGRRSQALAWRIRADRADTLRWRRYRHVERPHERRRVDARRRAHAANRQARPLHHRHRLRQLRHRRRCLRGPAHQGQLHRHSRRRRSRHLRSRNPDQEARPPALVHRRSRSST